MHMIAPKNYLKKKTSPIPIQVYLSYLHLRLSTQFTILSLHNFITYYQIALQYLKIKHQSYQFLSLSRLLGIATLIKPVE